MMGLVNKYFVLKPSGNDQYAAASRAALKAYSLVIREENLELSNDLRQWVRQEYLIAHPDPEDN